MGQIIDDFNSTFENYRQNTATMQAHRILKEWYQHMLQIDVDLNEIKDSGKFDQIPTSIKQALNEIWQELKNAIANIESNPEMSETISWQKPALWEPSS